MRREDLWNSIKNPPIEFRPYVRWWWPGMDVTQDELKKELQELFNQGFGGAEIQSFLFGLPGEEKHSRKELLHRFAPHPFYYQIIEFVLKESKKLGLKIDLTIGSSWPPGNTDVTVENSLQCLLIGTDIIKGGKKVHCSIPPVQIPPYFKLQNQMKGILGPILERFHIEDFKPLVTVAVKPIKKRRKLNYVFPKATLLDFSTAINITEFTTSDGYIDWDVPDGDWEIFTFYQGPSGMCPMLEARSAPEKQSLVVDLFNEDRIKKYLESHLSPLIQTCKSYFGNTLRALFTDSQEIASEWFFTDDFFNEFHRRRGYDVRPYLPVCFVPNRDNQFLEVFFQGSKPCYDFKNEVGERIRYDWWETLSELWAERFCNGVSKWANPFGIQHRIQTYGIHTDILKAYGAADIPETEQLFAGGLMDFLKIAGSAGVIYEKPIVSCEAMVWQFRDHITTPLKWKVAADRLFVAGINQLIYHGFPYFPSKSENPNFEFPGYDTWPSHSTNLNRENPFWSYYPLLNAYVSRGQFLMRLGAICADIGVFYPHYNYDYKFLNSEDLRGGHLPGFDIPPAGGPIVWFMKKPRTNIDRLTKYHHELGNQLREHGYYYIHFNEECFLRADITDENIVMGNARLKVLIFPQIKKMSLAMVDKLNRCVKSGIKVIFMGEIPNGQPGFKDYQENDQIINQKIKAIFESGGQKIPINQNIGNKLISEFHFSPALEFSPPDKEIYYIKRIIDDNGFIYFIRSGHQIPIEYDFNFIIQNAVDFVPMLINLWNGESQQIGAYYLEQSKIKIKLKFAPYESFMIYFVNKNNNLGIKQLPFVSDINSPLKRYEENLYFIFTKPGSAEIRLSNSSIREIQRNDVMHPSIILKSWHLSCNKRTISGDTDIIEKDFDHLIDWRLDKDLRYLNGPGIYTSQFHLTTNDLIPELHWILNLGKVCDSAEIYLNDKLVTVLFAPPYEIDITSALFHGENHIKIIVKGCLRNLLVGYGISGDKRYSRHIKKPLMSTGLIGPVTLNCERHCKL